ncbi:hypothetical protein ACIO52_25955 [Nocardia sp. NPDC087230]|uniref:hypothetical protein n=1 Tax=Nocardia sp. NPDC087230 TaxID=3364331 RepID=UPI0038028CC7
MFGAAVLPAEFPAFRTDDPAGNRVEFVAPLIPSKHRAVFPWAWAAEFPAVPGSAQENRTWGGWCEMIGPIGVTVAPDRKTHIGGFGRRTR